MDIFQASIISLVERLQVDDLFVDVCKKIAKIILCLNLFNFFNRNLWNLEVSILIERINAAKLKAKVGVAMMLSEVVEWTAIVRPNSI